MVALVCLTSALLCFHATAHGVVRYFRISYPISRFNRFAGSAFNVGLLAMYLSIAVLMMARGLRIESGLTALAGSASLYTGLFASRRKARLVDRKSVCRGRSQPREASGSDRDRQPQAIRFPYPATFLIRGLQLRNRNKGIRPKLTDGTLARLGRNEGVRKMQTAERKAVIGSPDLESLTTSHVERAFLTVRQELKRFERKGLAIARVWKCTSWRSRCISAFTISFDSITRLRQRQRWRQG